MKVYISRLAHPLIPSKNKVNGNEQIGKSKSILNTYYLQSFRKLQSYFLAIANIQSTNKELKQPYIYVGARRMIFLRLSLIILFNQTMQIPLTCYSSRSCTTLINIQLERKSPTNR